MFFKRTLLPVVGLVTLVAVVAAVAIGAVGAQTPGAPYSGVGHHPVQQLQTGRAEYRSVHVQREPVTLPNGDSGVGTLAPDTAASDLSKFTLGSGTHPVAAVVEVSGLIVEADFPPSVNVGLFEHASVSGGAVASTPGASPARPVPRA